MQRAMDKRNPRRRGRRGAASRTAEPADTAAPLPQEAKPKPLAAPAPSLLTAPIPQDTPRFADLASKGTVHPVLLQTITQDLKFDHMMPVQAATLDELLPPRRSDCLVQAKTGTGKTLAFLLPAVQTMLTKGGPSSQRGRGRGVSLLVLSPTRELALQIAGEADRLLQRLPGYRVLTAIGGTNKNTEEANILRGCDILIATPGRLLDHLSNESIRAALREVDTLVLDEADRLLDMGFKDAIVDIVGNLPDKAATGRQGMLFSATIAPHVEKAALLVCAPGHKFISTITPGEANTHERVPQHLITAPTFATTLIAAIAAIRTEAAAAVAAGNSGGAFKAIIFAQTAVLADLYGQVLASLADPPLPAVVSVLHSHMTQSKRTRITNDFREARGAAVLVATDVVARGMDFPAVTAVFQVGIPERREAYVHRLGRTARAGAGGHGVFVVCEAESFFPQRVLRDVTFAHVPADLSCSDEVLDIIATQLDAAQKARIYQSWLGYHHTLAKGFGWTKEQLVKEANTFASDLLGCADPPPVQKSRVGKMGLRGTRGLNVVPDEPRNQGRRGGAGSSGGNRKGGDRSDNGSGMAREP